jgi:hypothetical protein
MNWTTNTFALPRHAHRKPERHDGFALAVAGKKTDMTVFHQESPLFILSLFIILHFRVDHKQNGSRLLIKRMRKFLRGLNQLEIRLHHLETVSLAEKRPDGFCDLCEKGLLVTVEIDEQQMRAIPLSLRESSQRGRPRPTR